MYGKKWYHKSYLQCDSGFPLWKIWSYCQNRENTFNEKCECQNNLANETGLCFCWSRIRQHDILNGKWIERPSWNIPIIWYILELHFKQCKIVGFVVNDWLDNGFQCHILWWNSRTDENTILIQCWIKTAAEYSLRWNLKINQPLYKGKSNDFVHALFFDTAIWEFLDSFIA